ncbi:hypothetical protein [Sphaerothrix gracilis]|uniref:hypothetical protein n=1 Tax=Sphaerothrix gracilis TaxID=3151835 RepID=UPI0031FCF803
MQVRWKRFAIAALIAFPAAFLLRWVATQFAVEVACVWEESGEVHKGTDEQCQNLPASAVVIELEQY